MMRPFFWVNQHLDSEIGLRLCRSLLLLSMYIISVGSIFQFYTATTIRMIYFKFKIIRGQCVHDVCLLVAVC